MDRSKLDADLIGQKLHGQWVIKSPRPRSHGATGACHSFGYIAENPNGEQAFVKVLDPKPDESLETEAQLTDLQRRLDIFIYEKNLLDKRLSKKIRRVVKALGYESIKLNGYPGPIYYLLPRLSTD